MGETEKKHNPLNCTMSLGDHLEELRARLILALFGLTLGAVVALIVGTHIIRFIKRPYVSAMKQHSTKIKQKVVEPNEVAFVELFFAKMAAAMNADPNAPALDPDEVAFFREVSLDAVRTWRGVSQAEDDALSPWDRLQVLAPAEAFIAYMKVSFIAGLILTCPWVFYQLWMFVAAGLYEHEQRYVRTAVPFSAGLFVAGAMFFLFVIAPLSLKFFLFFGDALGVASNWTLQRYISFVTLLMLVFGVGFQTPIAIFILVRTGLTSIEALRGARKFVILGIFVLAAIATPPDVISQVALAIPLFALYELGMVLASLVGNEEAQRRFKAGLKLAGVVVLVGAIGWGFSEMINQYGHALGAKLVGATVTEIQPFVFLGRPHCSYEEGLSAGREALITLAGLLVSVSVGLLGLLVVPFRKLGTWAGLTLAAFFVPLLAQSLEWVVFPVLHVLEEPVRHDATTFVQQTGFHPLIVALIGVGLAVLAFRAFRWRTQFSANLRAHLDRAARGS
ncbi:MAG: twin-arginine translocase subunit TatC [Phycisphaerales bacterium]|nr:MAG: twin-arginine translocase subunit TatC [Phycisphaerales bacterium]